MKKESIRLIGNKNIKSIKSIETFVLIFQTYWPTITSTRFPKSGPTQKVQMIKAWHQTPQLKSVAKPGPLL